MTNNVKYRQLRAFQLAAEFGSFAAGAAKLFVSQPSFTMLIKELEVELGVRLFDRTTRHISLTAAGRDFQIRIQRPLMDIEEAYNRMRDLAEVKRGSLVLGALPSMAIRLIPPTLKELQKSHPTLQIRVIEVHNDVMLEMLQTNEVELGLGTLLSDVPGMAFKPVAEDRFVVLCPHSYRGRLPARMTWRDLAPHDLILTSQGSTPRTQFERAGGQATSQTRSRYDVTHMITAVQMVRQGLGVAVLPQLALPALPIEGMHAQALADASARRKVGVIHRKDRSPSPAAEVFMTVLAQVASKIKV